MHEIATADKKLFRKRLDGEITVQVFIDIMKYFGDFPVGGTGLNVAE